MLDFQKLEILTADPLYGGNMRYCTKSHQDRSNRGGDIGIFVIFQDGGRRHLGFSKIRNFNGGSDVR